MAAFGELLRQHRENHGWSLRAFERSAATSRSQLSDLERGHRQPSLAVAKHLDQVLNAGGALLAAALGVSKEADLRRRALLTALTTISGVAVTAPLASLEATRQGVATAMGDLPDADEWQGIVADYSRDYYTTPPADLIRDLSADLLVLQQVIEARRDDPAGRELQRAAAQLCTIMALALGSAGRSRLAGRWWGTARRAADRSGDAVVRAWARGRETVRGLYERRPLARLIALAEESLSWVTPPCAGVMELLGGQAQALSMLGDADRARHTLTELDEAFGRLAADVTADDSVAGWAEYRLWHTRSYVSTHLGDTSMAYHAQDRALALYPPELSREAAMVRLHRARCLVIDGCPEDGIQLGCSALDDLDAGYRSGPVAELGQAVLAALPVANRRRADDLRQRLIPAPVV